MRAPAIVEIQIPAKPGPGFGDAGIGVQIHLLILHRAPEPCDEDVVALGCLAVHADGNLVFQQQPGEVTAGELAALVGIENLRLAVPGECFLNRLDAEFHLQRDRQFPGQHPPAESVHHRRQIHKAARHRDVGDVHRPHLVRPVDHLAAQQVWANPVAWSGL